MINRMEEGDVTVTDEEEGGLLWRMFELLHNEQASLLKEDFDRGKTNRLREEEREKERED